MYCKKCVCGHINTYEQAGLSPMRCIKCSRMLLSVTEEIYSPEMEAVNKPPSKKMYIKFGEEKILVDKRMVFGRNAEGKEWFVNFLSISREHFEITPRASGVAANIIDKSSYYTMLNGEKMEKEKARRLTAGARINLSGCVELEFIIE